MSELADRLLAARRKGWLRSRPIFAPHAQASATDLTEVERRIGRSLPLDLKAWLLRVGYGDIDQALSFRNEWFQPVEEGEHKGGFIFAQDELGNFYACPRDDGRVVFFSRSEPAYAVIAPSFDAFLSELERRDYKIVDWMESATLSPYAWSAA